LDKGVVYLISSVGLVVTVNDFAEAVDSFHKDSDHGLAIGVGEIVLARERDIGIPPPPLRFKLEFERKKGPLTYKDELYTLEPFPGSGTRSQIR
jgi:hypothetical protein